MPSERYDQFGQRKLTTRLQTRRQLEQWGECRGVYAQSEQCADECEHQHWLSRRQELRAPVLGYLAPARVATDYGQSQRAIEDLQFVLSKPRSFLGWRLNTTVGGKYRLYKLAFASGEGRRRGG